MLSQEQRREIAAVVLAAIAVLFLLALFPVSLLGARGEAWFPNGNMIGVVGGTLRGLIVAFVGGSAALVPLLIGLAGVPCRRMAPRGDRALRLAVLFAGLVLLIPAYVRIATESAVAAGWLGATLGGPLVGLLGHVRRRPWFAAYVSWPFRSRRSVWNPLRSVGRGMLVGGDVAGRTAKVLAEKGREYAEAKVQAASPARGGRGPAGRGLRGGVVG